MGKTIVKGILLVGIVSLAFVSCSNPLQGMWIDKPAADETGKEYWLTFDKQEFEYVILSDPYTIEAFYKGAYEIDKKAGTVKLSASSVTDGQPVSGGDAWDWKDSEKEFIFPYVLEDGVLKITIAENTVIELVEREQPIELLRALAAGE